jgi:hypothetical protein
MSGTPQASAQSPALFTHQVRYPDAALSPSYERSFGGNKWLTLDLLATVTRPIHGNHGKLRLNTNQICVNIELDAEAARELARALIDLAHNLDNVGIAPRVPTHRTQGAAPC